MQDLPNWGLALAYWLHMLATVTWLGGLATLAILVIPNARRMLNADDYALFLEKMQSRLQQVGWFSLAVLTGTGMFQMSAHPSYEGFLAIENSWSVAILAKHGIVALMIVVSAYNTWGLTPALRRLALMRAAGKELQPDIIKWLQKQEDRLLVVNGVLSVLVLLLTAVARAS
ncbi:MAG: CopD family protein [Chloroflexota bacterium]